MYIKYPQNEHTNDFDRSFDAYTLLSYPFDATLHSLHTNSCTHSVHFKLILINIWSRSIARKYVESLKRTLSLEPIAFN